MTRASSFAGVILAAGESSRMGCDKALLPWPPAQDGQAAAGGTFLSAAIRAFSAAAEFVVVVVGRNQAALAPVIFGEGASLVVNEEPERGQFSSLQVGLREVLNRGRDAAMITLVDRPSLASSTLIALVEAFEQSDPRVWAVVPEFEGRHGHPFLIGREMIEAFLQAPVTATAREVEHAHAAHIQYVALNDAGIARNVNTPEEYDQLKPE